MEEIRFDGKVAVITGAGAGLGREYAIAFAKRGAKVVVNDLGSTRDGSGANHLAADAVVEEITKMGGIAAANYDSVSTVQGGKSLVKTALDAFGRIDILVNNAGIIRDKTILKMKEEDWDTVMNVHLRGAFCATQPALEIMREQNYGRIIVTCSISGLFGNFGQANYGAAKMGLLGFMNTLKLETAKYNIHINAVAPNAASRMTEDVLPPEIAGKLQAKFNVPMVMYLCSEACPENGSTFVMGAGWFGRAAIVCGNGAALGDGHRDISAEEVRDNFARIANLNGAKPLDNSLDVFQFMAPLLK